MDIINIFSFAQIVYLTLFTAIFLGLYYGFRNKARYIKITLLYILAGINLLQHLFKFLIWPNCFHTSFNLINTAYNVCAFQIIITPFLVEKEKGLLKEFNVYVGTIGSFLSFVYPNWFIGKTIFQWEFLRFATCHFLLLATSLLPFLWGMVKFDKRNYWKQGIVWFFMLCTILLNDVLCIMTGLQGDPTKIYETLYELNPISIMHPAENVPFLNDIIPYLTPAIFLGQISGIYTPILWYMIPIYALMTPTAYGLASLWEYLGEKFYICGLDKKPLLKKSEKFRYLERRNYTCKSF